MFNLILKAVGSHRKFKQDVTGSDLHLKKQSLWLLSR